MKRCFFSDLSSKTATIGIGDLWWFWRRVTDVTLNFSSARALNIVSSGIEVGMFLIITDRFLYSGS